MSFFKPTILISSHDLIYLEELLVKRKASGVNVYSHGEMLPAQYYPVFKKIKTISAIAIVQP